MLGSNQRPLPCEGSTIVCWRFLELAKFLQTVIFLRQCFSQHFSSFTQVAAQLLHRRYCPHPHKARHDFFPSIAGCVDIDPRTPCRHNWSSNPFVAPTVFTHHAIRVNHTEIRCSGSLLLMDIEVESFA